MAKTITLPSDWKTAKFKMMFDRLTRKNRDENSNVLTISAYYGLISQEEFFNKSVASEDLSGYYLLKRGDFVYNKSYSAGYNFGAFKQLTHYDSGVVSPLYICFTPSASNKCPEFYVQIFESMLLDREIKTFAQEGARNHGLLNIAVDDFFSMPIPVPPLAEQRRIAEILAAQDSRIALKQRLIDAKKQQKRWLMQNLLTGKVRLPGFSDEWKQVRLGDIGKWRKGSGISKEEARSGSIPAIRYGELYTVHDEYIKQFHSFISEDVAEYSVKLRQGDVLFTCSGETKEEIGKSAAFLDDCVAFAGGDLIILSPDSICQSKFLGYALNSYSIAKQKARFGQGDSIVHISAESLKKIVFGLPSFSEQTAIAERLTTADREIELLARELTQQKLVKKYLMQQLLTGKTRVKEESTV